MNKRGLNAAAVLLTIILIALGGYTLNLYLKTNGTEAFSGLKKDVQYQEPQFSNNPHNPHNPQISQNVNSNTDFSDDKLKSKWGYVNLTDWEKKVYSRIYQSIEKENPYCSVSDLNIDVNGFKKIFDILLADNPQFYTLKKDYSYLVPSDNENGVIKSLKFNYVMDFDKAAFNQKVKKIIDAANLQPDNYSKIKYIHDWIINNTVYDKNYSLKDKNSSVFRPDGPILYGKAVCEGYAKAFCYLAQQLNIPAICVSGTATDSYGSTGGHMWNGVRVDNDWYYLDVTWDDPTTFTGENVLRYDYFLLPFTQMLNDHNPEILNVLPPTPSHKYG